MEVDVLRIALLKESWQCLADDESPSCVADPASEAFPPLSAQPRSRPRELKGEWKVFDVTAVPLPDDAALGEHYINTSHSDFLPWESNEGFNYAFRKGRRHCVMGRMCTYWSLCLVPAMRDLQIDLLWAHSGASDCLPSFKLQCLKHIMLPGNVTISVWECLCRRGAADDSCVLQQRDAAGVAGGPRGPGGPGGSILAAGKCGGGAHDGASHQQGDRWGCSGIIQHHKPLIAHCCSNVQYTAFCTICKLQSCASSL